MHLITFALTPEHNARLQSLVGPTNCYIQHLEEVLDVQITNFSFDFRVQAADQITAEFTQEIIETLYKLTLKQGKVYDLDYEDLYAVIHVVRDKYERQLMAQEAQELSLKAEGRNVDDIFALDNEPTPEELAKINQELQSMAAQGNDVFSTFEALFDPVAEEAPAPQEKFEWRNIDLAELEAQQALEQLRLGVNDQEQVDAILDEVAHDQQELAHEQQAQSQPAEVANAPFLNVDEIEKLLQPGHSFYSATGEMEYAPQRNARQAHEQEWDSFLATDEFETDVITSKAGLPLTRPDAAQRVTPTTAPANFASTNSGSQNSSPSTQEVSRATSLFGFDPFLTNDVAAQVPELPELDSLSSLHAAIMEQIVYLAPEVRLTKITKGQFEVILTQFEANQILELKALGLENYEIALLAAYCATHHAATGGEAVAAVKAYQESLTKAHTQVQGMSEEQMDQAKSILSLDKEAANAKFRIFTKEANRLSRMSEVEREQEQAALNHNGKFLEFNNGVTKARTVNQDLYLRSILDHDITFGIGPAGTGKTFLAVAVAVDYLVNKRVKRIVLTRPAVEAGENLGFLPGDLSQKLDPYLKPLFDALQDLIGAQRLQKLMETGIIEIAPLAYMRGRTLTDSFIILDEAQNTTVEQMKMFLTRLGFGSKMVVTGDTSQIDLPSNKLSGLVHAQEVLSNIDAIKLHYFNVRDIVRHPTTSLVVGAYEKWEAENPQTGSQRRKPKSKQVSLQELIANVTR